MNAIITTVSGIAVLLEFGACRCGGVCTLYAPGLGSAMIPESQAVRCEKCGKVMFRDVTKCPIVRNR